MTRTLRKDALGLVQATAIGVAGTAPAYTIAASSAALFGAVGLLAPGSAPSQLLVTAVAAGWIIAIALLEVRGMRLTGTVQTWITCIEIAVLAVLALAATLTHWPQISALLAQARLSPLAFTPQHFAAGAVIAVFFFWGWDVPLNASEETVDARRTSGLAAALATLIVACAFIAFAFVTLAVLSEPEIQSSGANIVYAIAGKLLPHPWSVLAVLAVMLSSVGSLQVSLLQFARTLFSAARAGEAHARWSQVHARWQTPHLAVGLGGIALGLVPLVRMRTRRAPK